MSSTIFSDPHDTVQARHEQRRQAARQRWPEYPAADLDNRSGYLIDKGSGLLFKPVRHVVFARDVEFDNDGKTVAGFYDSGGELHFFERAENPGTVEELEEMEAARARQQQEREQGHAGFLREQPLRSRCRAGRRHRERCRRCGLPSATAARPRRARSRTGRPTSTYGSPSNSPQTATAVEAMKRLVRAVRVLDAPAAVVLAELAKGGSRPSRSSSGCPIGTLPHSVGSHERPGPDPSRLTRRRTRRIRPPPRHRTPTRTRQTPSRCARSRTTQARQDRPRTRRPLRDPSTRTRRRPRSIRLRHKRLRSRYGSRPHADTAAEPTSTQSREHAPKKHGVADDSSEPTRPRFASDDARKPHEQAGF